MSFENISVANSLLGLTVGFITASILYKAQHTALTSKNGIPLPPGPPARWFWETALPTVNVARTLTNMVAKYGPVVALRQGSQVIIVIGGTEAANEIMEKEGAALADRPREIAMGEMHGKNLRFLYLHSGERLRRYRKTAHTHLQPKATVAYHDMQMEGARNLIMDILNDPTKHQNHAERFSASLMLRMTYGKLTPIAGDDPIILKLQQSSLNFQRAAHPGAFLVDRIPFLKYVPGYGRELQEYHELDLQLYREQMGRVESELETSQCGNSFMRMLLENPMEHGLSREEMAYLAGDFFGAGSGTTAISIMSMILAAACHPDAQSWVQEELDQVVGRDRMPTWDDLESLPRLHAFISETHRWRPVTPIGFAHRATRDIVWRGQWIPAGANVLGCHWAICRDPVVFPDPDRFDPQRWIDNNGRLRNNMSAYAYGFGRRACPGQYLATKSLYIILALLLWSFRIVERPDAPINPNAFTDGVIGQALPFEVNFLPRTEKDWLREMMSESAM